MLLLIDTFNTSEVGLGDTLISTLSFSTFNGTLPGSPIVKVNVVFSPSDARFPPLTFWRAKSYLVPSSISELDIVTTEVCGDVLPELKVNTSPE